MKTQQMSLADHPLARAVVTVAAFLFVVWCVKDAKEFLVPIFMASLLAMLMAPLVRLLKRTKLPDTLAVLLAVIILYLPLIGIASLVLIEANSLVSNWPSIYASAKGALEHFMSTPLFHNITPADYFDLSDIQTKITDKAGEGAILLLAGLKAMLSAGTTTLLVLTLAAIMLFSRNHLRLSAEKIIAANNHPDKAKTLNGVLEVLEKFLIARVLIVVFVAIADFIILKLFGIPYSVTLSALLGITTVIPVVGFFIGIIPPLIVSASMDHSALFIGGLTLSLFAVSSAQDHVLTPALIGRRLNLNFLATYFALFAGEQLWGLWGMFLSIPALGLLRVILAASDDFKSWAYLLAEE